MTWLVAIIGSVAGFLFGYDEGIIAGSLALVKADFALTSVDVGVMTSALPFGALFGAMFIGVLLASRFVKRFGRRFLLSFAGFLFLLGTVGTALTTSMIVLVISRFVLGLAIGISSVTTPLYLAETAPIKIRGAVVAIYQLAITLGIVSAYWMNYLLLEQEAWRIMFASSAIPALIVLIGMYFLPESPRWLLSVGNQLEARRALKRLRPEGSIQGEFDHIKATLANEPKRGHWKYLLQKPLSSVLTLGIILFCLQQLSGINVIIYFAPEIFKNLGFNSNVGQILATIGIGSVNVFVTILALFWVDKIGRRKLLLWGFSGTCLSLSVLSMCSFYHLPGLGWLSVLCLTLYIVSFAISLGPIPHIAMAEIFPLHVRGAGMGLSSVSNWGFNTLMVFSFPILHAKLGIESTFALYALVCLAGLLYTFYWMPETKNLSLEDIEDYLMRGKPLRELGRTDEVLMGELAPRPMLLQK